MTIKPGITTHQSHIVTQDDLALNWGGDVPVLASPVLIGLLEQTCALAVQDQLPAGKTTVGVGFDVLHLAPTPVEEGIILAATLTDIDGKQLRYTVEAHDSEGVIFSGTHFRGIVDRDRFLERIEGRLASDNGVSEESSE